MPSIYKILQQAGANDVKFVPAAATKNHRYGTPNFDQTLYKEQFMDWENSSRYSLKRQYEDKSTFQFHSNSNGAWTLNLINCDGQSVKSYLPSVTSYPGNIYHADGIDFNLYTATFDIDFINIDAPIPEGTYYFKLTVQYDTQAAAGFEETDVYISEPILLALTHVDTIAIEYTHNRIQFNTIFNGKKFSQRIEGYVGFAAVDSSDTQYHDSNWDMVLLNSYPYRKFKFYFGGVAGVSDYMVDRLNIALGCTTTLLDGKPLTKDEGAKFNTKLTDRRMWGDIDMREPKNYDEQTFLVKSSIILFAISPGQSALRQITLGTNKLSTAFVMDSTSVNQTLLFLNNSFKSANGLTGTFSQQGNNIVYSVGPSETYQSGSAVILTKWFTLGVNTSGSWSFINNSKWAVVQWIDGAVSGYGNGTFVSTTFSHSDDIFGLLGNQIKFWHEDSIRSFVVSNLGVVSITGTMPTAMTNLQINSSGMTSFDANIFPTYDTVIEITVKNSQLTSVTNLFKPWIALNNINFTGNKLNQTGIDSVLFQVYGAANSSVPLQSGAHALAIQTQTPSAPPSATGNVTKSALISSYGWTVTTD